MEKDRENGESEKIPNPSDHDIYFRTDHLKADLKRRSVRGGTVTMTTQLLKFSANIGSTIILARLLTPQDYGLVGMVTVVLNFVILFKDLGLSMATVQKAEINHRQVSTLFWINLVLSCGLLFITAALAPLIAWFYGEPRLIAITLALASGFIFGGLTAQHQALLNRQMRFTTLSAIDLTSMFVGVGTAIILASYGAGYWALVIMQLTGGLTNTIAVWLMCSWRPSLPTRNAEVRSMLNFGGNLTGYGIINYFARNVDNLLIGKFWGKEELGVYAKAYQLLLLPIQQVNAPVAAVAVPALSRLVEDSAQYRQVYLRVVEKIAMLTMPGIMFMIVTSDWLIQVLLGSQWGAAIPIFTWLGIAALTQPICNSTGWLFITQGRTKDMFQWGLIGETMAVIAIVIGLPWHAYGVAVSYSICTFWLRTPVLFWFVCRTGPIKTGDFYRLMIPSACASGGVLLALLALRQWGGISDALIGAGLSLAITTVVALVIFAILPAGKLALLDSKNLFTLLIKNKSKTS